MLLCLSVDNMLPMICRLLPLPCRGVHVVLFEGEGTAWYASGNRYVGQWKSGKSHGEGTYHYATGARSEKLFVFRMQHAETLGVQYGTHQ